MRKFSLIFNVFLVLIMLFIVGCSNIASADKINTDNLVLSYVMAMENGYDFKILDKQVLKCPGCFVYKIEYKYQVDSEFEKVEVQVTVDDFEVIEAKEIKRKFEFVEVIKEEFIVYMTKEEAIEIAMQSECVIDGKLTDKIMYNENSKTWWIDLDLDKEGCFPACVIFEDGHAEINWRCTGLKS